MQYDRLALLADRIANYSLKLRKGDRCLIAAGHSAMPLVNAFAGTCVEIGAVPIPYFMDDELTRLFLCSLPQDDDIALAKTYGTKKLAEGTEFAGCKLVLIEDVVTSGGQINLSASDLRDLGAIVDTAVCVIDRDSGGGENLKRNRIELISLFRMADLQG